MKKKSTSQASWALITEGVTNARIEAHRLKHLMSRARKIVDTSPAKDHIYEVAGDIILSAPDRLAAIERSLDRTAYALSYMGQDFLRGRIPFTDRQIVEDTQMETGQIKNSARRVTARYLKRVKNEKG